MESFAPTDRTQVKRLAKRATYDRVAVYAILDEAMICHVAFNVEGSPVVIPTAYGRKGDTLYIHGAPASRMLRTLQQGVECSVAVTLVDGLVLARSAFHHSLNYRSVVIFGKARLVEGRDEKNEALRAFTEHVTPGRWDVVRQPSEAELRGTTVLALPLEEVSAKVRTGPPVDDAADMSIPVWAGVLPVYTRAGAPVPDEGLPEGVAGYAVPGRYSR